MQDQPDEYEVHTKPLFIARVKRETGMALLRQAINVTDPAHRNIILQQVASLFSESYALLRKESDADVEAAVTLSYMGQQLLIRGDRDGAYRFMEEADRTLSAGNTPYQELENLIALLHAAEPTQRRILYRRIKRLLSLTDQMQRRTEIKLFVIGGDPLLDFVARHPSIFTTISRLYRK